ALLIFFTTRSAFFRSRRYTTVWTVVYAGLSRSGKASCISRTQEAPWFRKIPIISISSLVSFAIRNHYVHITITIGVRMQDIFGYCERREGSSKVASGTLDWSQCPAVESVPDRGHGAWVFKNTRMPVATVFENLESGATIEEIMEWFDVTR